MLCNLYSNLKGPDRAKVIHWNEETVDMGGVCIYGMGEDCYMKFVAATSVWIVPIVTFACSTQPSFYPSASYALDLCLGTKEKSL